MAPSAWDSSFLRFELSVATPYFDTCSTVGNAVLTKVPRRSLMTGNDNGKSSSRGFGLRFHKPTVPLRYITHGHDVLS